MISYPTMLPNEKLRNIRSTHPSRLNRTQLAKALNEFHNLENVISPGIIRDIEEGLSSRWLPQYVSYAVANWGITEDWLNNPEAAIPIIQPNIVRESSPNYQHDARYQPLLTWQGSPVDHDIEFRPIKKYTSPKVTLPEPPDEYFALIIFSFNLGLLFPHGSTVIIRRTETPPTNSIVLVESPNQTGVIRGMIADSSGFHLYPFNSGIGLDPETKLPGQKFVGYVVAIISDYDPRHNFHPNITYNDGGPILFHGAI